MMGRYPSIRELHQMAYTRDFPRADVHEIVHDIAEAAFGVRSLTELDGPQRRYIGESIMAHPPRPARRQPSPRKRSGQPRREGVVTMITPAQREFINTLASELGWTRSALNHWLTQFYGVSAIEELGTSAVANQAIQHLLTIKCDHRSRSRKRRAVAGGPR